MRIAQARAEDYQEWSRAQQALARELAGNAPNGEKPRKRILTTGRHG